MLLPREGGIVVLSVLFTSSTEVRVIVKVSSSSGRESSVISTVIEPVDASDGIMTTVRRDLTIIL